MAGPFVNRAHDKHARHTVVRGNVRSHVRSGDEWCTTIHSYLFDLRSHVAERDGGEEEAVRHVGERGRGLESKGGMERHHGGTRTMEDQDGQVADR